MYDPLENNNRNRVLYFPGCQESYVTITVLITERFTG